MEEEGKGRFVVKMGNKEEICYLDRTKETHMISIGRKEKSSKLKGQEKINRIVIKNNPRLSSDHAFLTITKKNIEGDIKILENVFKKQLPKQIIQMILGYLYSNIQVTIRDLGSSCGTYLPKNRPLGIQQFWVMNQQTQLSFGIYLISSPESPKINDTSLIQYIQCCGVDSDDENIKQRALSCKTTDLKQICETTRYLQKNFLIAVLSHKSLGYVFIKRPQNNKIKIDNCFQGSIVNSMLEITSNDQIYTNIYKQKKNDHGYSDAFLIKPKQCLIIGEERCYLNVQL